MQKSVERGFFQRSNAFPQWHFHNAKYAKARTSIQWMDSPANIGHPKGQSLVCRQKDLQLVREELKGLVRLADKQGRRVAHRIALDHPDRVDQSGQPRCDEVDCRLY